MNVTTEPLAGGQLAETEKQTIKIPGELGIWLFIAGDLIVFSVFFIIIAVGQSQQTQMFEQSRSMLDLRIGVLNTLLLLTGSWFAAIAVEKSKASQTKSVKRYFSLAIICGAGFVINKVLEWSSKIVDGVTPATNEFFMYFFIFTGIHLVHVLIGIGILFMVRGISQRPTLSKQDTRSIETGTLFWHLVDLLWVVLFALLYLL